MRSIADQMRAMKKHWPDFEVARQTDDTVIWFGWLVGIECRYRVSIEYGLPRAVEDDEMWRRFPLVRVMSPRLEPNFDAADEAPLPHVYFDRNDLTLSPLCLFDPDAGQWTLSDLIALTTVPWAADWLACYEGWRATWRWFGGGRHAAPKERNELA